MHLYVSQEMSGQHTGAVWCCKFSVCGRLLATAGQDKVLRVWVTRDASNMFHVRSHLFFLLLSPFIIPTQHITLTRSIYRVES